MIALIRCLFVLGLLCFYSFAAFSQQAIAIQARHETLNQDAVDVRFDLNVQFLGPPSTTGWSVRVNGTPVTVVSVAAVAANVIRVTFDATLVTGNPWLRPGDTVNVAYDGTGNVRTQVSNDPVVPFPFPPGLASQNNHVLICEDYTFVQQGEIFPGAVDVCDPVVPTRFYEYQLSRRARNSSTFVLANSRIRILWGTSGIGTGPDVAYVAQELNPVTAPGLLRVTPNVTPQVPTTIHQYPATDAVCSYTATIAPRIFNGAAAGANCAIGALVQQTTFASYSTDNRNTGTLRLNDTPANSRFVCLGTNANMQFADATDLNCRAGAGLPNPAPNEQRRWVRFVYGVPDLGPGGNIPNIRVGATAVTDAAGNLLHPGGFVITGVGGDNVPDFQGVISIPPNVTAPTQLTAPITTTSPAGQAVGQRFNVTMQYWNVCNPYTFTISGQEEVVNFVQIIDSPPPPLVNNPSLCETAGTGSYLITASGSGAGTLTYTWYLESTLATVLQATSTDNTFNPATEGPAIHRIPTTVSASTTHNRFVTVTQGSNNCTSQPATITIRIDDQNTPGVIGHPLGGGPTFTVCTGTDPAAFTNTTSGTGGGPGGTFTYQWQSSPDGITYTDIPSATGATFDPGPLTVRTFFRRRLISGNCPTVSSNAFEFRVDTPVTPGAVGANQTICASPGDPALLTQTAAPGGGDGSNYAFQWEESSSALGPYNTIAGATSSTYDPPPGVTSTTFYRRRVTSGVCVPNNVAFTAPVTITVHQLNNPGAIGNAQIICSGQDPTPLTNVASASGGDGSNYVYQWQSSPNGTSGWTDISGANATTFDPPVLTATTFYRRRVRSPGPGSTCPEAFSNVIQVTVHPLPTASNPTGGGAVCGGNPAPDITWNFTGTPPFNFTISRSFEGPLNVVGHGSLSYTIVAPSPPASQTYQITALTDANGCVGTSLGSAASVTISLTPPPSIDSFTASAPVCDDGGSTNPPDALLDLAPDLVQDYSVTYFLRRVSTGIDGPPIGPSTFTSNASGLVTLSPTYAQMGGAPDILGYRVIITSLFNVATGCAAAVPISGPVLIVNPRPPAPTGAVQGIACSTAPTGAPISVADPGAGFTIVWSSTAAPAFNAASGVTGGTRGNQFTPSGNASFTYHAFTRSDLSPTNCLSAASLPVQHIQDVPPTIAGAGPDQQRCDGNFTLAGNAPNAGILEVGTWTVPGIAYLQNFSAYANGTTTSAAVNGWTIDTSAPGVFTGGTGSFSVQSNRFEATNTDGTGAGGAEVVWRSPVITGTFPSLNISVELSSTPTHESPDYLRVFYRLNGGAETLLTNGNHTGNISGTVTATAVGLNVTASIQLVVRASNSATDETYRFDNIVMTNTGAPTIGDPNVRNTTIANLAVGVHTLTWTISSRYGVCPNSSDNVVLERYPLPAVNNLTPTLCEDVFGGGSTANVNLTTYDASVMGGTPLNTHVEYYPSLADRTAGTNQILAPITVTNGMVRFTRVRNTLTTCFSDGTITFTVRTLPAVFNQSAQICEDFPPGSNQATGINLQSYEAAITGGAPNRDVEWFTDAGFTTMIPSGTATGAEQNYTITADVTLHARVIDTASPTSPQCFRGATLNLDYQARPLTNQITDGIGTPLGASYTICASSNLVLLQINPGLNPGATYQWTIAPVSYPGEFELLSGTTGFFVILRFPNSTNPPAWAAGNTYSIGEIVAHSGNRYQSLTNGNINNMPPNATHWQFLSVNSLYAAGGIPITVRETLGTACFGNTIATNVIVEASPPRPIIAGPNSVCENQSGVVFSVTNPVAGSYSWTLPPGATITSLPVTDPSITVQMSTFGGSVGVTHSSGTGCVSPPGDPLPVTVVTRPAITSAASATLCSGRLVSAVHTLTSSIAGTTYNWQVISITGSVTGTAVGNSATGVTAISETLTNTSGLTATVTYRVTPIGPPPNNCAGASQDLVVTVNPEPVLVAGQAKTICSRDLVNYEIRLAPLNLPAGTRFDWPDPDGAGPATGGSSVLMGPAGTLHITDPLVNTGTTPISVVYVITPVSGAGCTGVVQNVVITVNPEPVGGNDASFPAVCSGTAVNYDLVNNVATLGNNLTTGTTFQWVAADNPSVTGESLTLQTGNAITDVIQNQTASVQNVVYTVTPRNGACVGANFTVTIAVNPEPVSANANLTRCSDVATGFTLTTTGGAAAATWTISINPNGLTASAGAPVSGPGQAAGDIADDAWTNTTLNPVNVIYTVTPVSALGCAGIARTVTVTVNPEPVGSSSAVTRCSDQAVNVTLTTSLASVAAATYNILVNPNGLTLSSGTNSAGTGRLANELVDDVWQNTGTVPVNVEYTITPVSGAGCPGDPFTVTVTVNPEPVGVVGSITRCSDVAVAFNLSTLPTSVGAASYTISVNPGGLTQSAGTPSGGTGRLATELADDVWRNTGTTFANVVYTIIPVSSLGCEGDPFTVTVRVNPEPVANNSTATVCSDVPVGVTLTTLGTSVAAATYNISTNTNGLTQSAGGVSAGTGRSATELADDAWTNNGLSPVNVIYTVTPVSADNCLGDPFTVTVTVNPEPIGNPQSVTRCSDEVLAVTLSTSGSAVAATSYNIAVNPNGLTQSAGTPSAGTARAANELADDVWLNTGLSPVNVVYTIEPVSAAGCLGNPFLVTVTVNPEPVGSNSAETRCSDQVLGITLSTSAGSVAAATYTIATNPNGLVQSAGTVSAGTGRLTGELADDAWRNTGLNPVDVIYTITPVSADNCPGNSFTVTVTVRPEPVGANSALTICSDNALGLTLTTSPLAVAAATFDISVAFGALTQSGGTPSAGPGRLANELADDEWRNTTTSPENVVYTITPVSAAPALCAGDPFTVTVTVNPEPVVAPATVSNICSDTPVGFTLSAGTAVPAATYNITVNPNGLTQSGGTPSAGTGRLANELADDRWTNTTAAPVNVVYSIIPVSAGPASCQGDLFTVTVQILPEPVVTSTTVTRCSDVALAVTLSAGTAVPAVTYNISVNSNGLTQSAGTPSNGTGMAAAELSDDVWRNTGAVPVNVIYTITPVSAAGCEGNPFTVTATINPEPVGIVGATTVCSDVAAGINIATLGSAVPAANFTIAVNPNGLIQSGGTASAGSGRSATEIADDRWTNITTAAVDVIYTITPFSSSPANCAGDPFVITVTVSPEPRGFNDTSPNTCSDVAFNYDLTANVANTVAGGNNLVTGITFSWIATSNPNVGGESLAPQAGPVINDILNNVTNAPQVVRYTVTPTVAGCVGDPFTVDVTVRPEPRGFTDSSPAICSDANVNYSLTANVANTGAGGNNLTAGTTYSWVAAVNSNVLGESTTPQSGGVINDVLNNVTAGNEVVEYTVTPTNAGCVGDPFIVRVTVRPEPVGQLDNTPVVCSNIAFTYDIQGSNINLNNGVPSRFTFIVSSSDEGAVPTPPALDRTVATSAPISGNFANLSGADVIVTYTITPFSISGNCQGDPFLVQVTVRPQPTANPVTNVAICSDDALNVNLQALITNGLASQFRYTVASSNPAVVFPEGNRTTATPAPITYTYTNLSNADVTITYTVTPVSSAGSCEGAPFEVRVVVRPEPVGINITDPICATSLNHDIQARHISTGGNSLPSVFTYTVSSSNPAPDPAGVPPGPNRTTPSSAPITDSYVNNSGAGVTITYLITPFNAAHPTCGGTPFTYAVTINSTPVGVSSTEVAVCSDIAYSINPQTNVNTPPGNSVVSTFTWTAVYAAGLAGGAGSGTGLIAEILTNNTAGVKNVVYTVVPTAGTCTGPSFTITKPVSPEPVVDPTVTPRTTCSDVASGIVLAATATSETPSAYDISLVSQDTDLTGSPTTGTGLAANALQNDQFNNSIRTNGLFVRWEVTPIGPVALGACRGNPLVVQLEVLPEPVMEQSAAFRNPAVCSDVASGIELATNGVSVNATAFFINSIEIGGVPIAPGATVGAVTSRTGNAAANPDPLTGGRPRTVIRNDIFTVTTDVPLASRRVTYNVRPRAGQCFGDTINIHLQIRPEPVIQSVVSPPVCSDVPFNISLSPQPTSVPIDSYNLNSINWDLLPAPGLQPGAGNFSTGVQDVGGPGVAGNLTINDRYVNATDQVLEARYVITPTSLAGCVGDPSTTTVNVSPAATVATGLDRIVCSDAVSGIVIQDQRTATGVGFPAQSFRVTPGTTGALTPVVFDNTVRVVNGATSTTIQPDRFVNSTNQPIVVNYTVEAWTGPGATGCTSLRTIGLTVEPAIITNAAASMNLRPDICSGDVTEIVLGSPSNPTPAGLNSPFSSPNDITFNYTVTGASVAPGFNLPEAAPNNVIQQVINNATNDPVTAVFRITPVAANARGGLGCTGAPTDVPVVVRPRPRMTASATNITICEDVPLAITLNSTTNPGAGAGAMEFDLQSILDPNTGNPSTFITVASNPAGPNVAPGFVLSDVPVTTALGQEAIRYLYRPQFSLGAGTCLGDPVAITVTVSPRPRIAPVPNFDVCSGAQFEQTVTVQQADPALTLVSWTAAVTTRDPANVTGAAGGAGELLAQVVFNRNPDPARVVYTFTGNTFGCAGPTQTLEVDVFPEPRLQNLARSYNICTGAPFAVNLQSNTNPAITRYRWTVDNGGNASLGGGLPDPGPATAINHVLTNAGTSLGTYTYTVTPFVITPSRQCTGLEAIAAVNVAPPVVGSLLSSDGDNSAFICENGRDFLFFEFAGLPLFEAVYTDGTSNFTLSRQGGIRVMQVNPATTTTYTLVSLRDGFGCVDANLNTPASRPSVTVNVGVTNANFDLITPAIACSPYQAQFRHNQAAGVNYTWRWFTGAPDSTYLATTTVPNQVVRHTFTNPSPNSNMRFRVFLDAFLDANYPGGCLKTTNREVQVFPTVAAAVFPDRTTICSGDEVTFTNTSQGVTIHNWFYRPIGTAQQLQARATSNVTYRLENTSSSNPLVMEVVYRATNGNCPAADVVTPITVFRGIVPDFANTTPTLFVGGNSTVTITNTSQPVDNNDFAYEWEFGLSATPASGTGIGPFALNYTTPGPKLVRLTTRNRAAAAAGLACVASAERTIQIAVPPLIADFVADPVRACFPVEVAITDNLATGDVFEWRVIDGAGNQAALSNVQRPVFQIPRPGRYTIQLTTRNSFTGDSRTALRDVEIFPKPVAVFQVRPEVVFVPDTEVTAFNFSEGANEYEWDFGDGNTSIDREPRHRYRVEGRYTITLEAMFNHGGGVICSDTATQQVTARQGGITLVPNAFTPDPSGPRGGVPGGAGTNSFNDVFLPIVKGAEEFNMQIFDRWGNLIFESNNAQIGWDGYDVNGRLMPNGVYVYKLTLRLSDGQRTTQIGDITLIR
jgi:gliding motility-associated-like protein